MLGCSSFHFQFCRTVLADIIQPACFSNTSVWKQATSQRQIRHRLYSVKRQRPSLHSVPIPVTLAHEPYANIQSWLPCIPPNPEVGPENARRWTDVVDNAESRPLIVDVRSPTEFARDHIPGAINLPVLDDEQRSKIGLLHSHGNISGEVSLIFWLILEESRIVWIFFRS